MADTPTSTEEERVNLRSADGALANVPISEAQAALDAGYSLASDEEVAAEKDKQFRQTAPEQVKTAAEGLVRGVTLGFGEPILAGISSAEDVKARKEASPELALGAEAVGAIAPLFATGGTGALATTARAVGVAPRALAGVGAAVERGAAGLLGRSIAGRAGAMGAAGAVEGAVFGAGQAVSEATLTDTELTGEMVAAGMGHGALLGGAVGGVFGAGIGVGAKAVEGVKGLAARARGILPAGSLGPTAAGAAVPAGENFVQRFTRGQKALKGLDDVQQAEIRSIRKDGTRKEELFDSITDSLNINNKIKAIGRSIDDDVALGTIARTSDETVREASEMVTNLKSELGLMARNAGKTFEVREVRAASVLKQFTDEADFAIRKLVQRPGVEHRPELFRHLDQLKRRLGKTQQRLGGRGTAGADDVIFTAGGILRAKYDEMAGHLVDPNLYGRAAADIQAPDNLAWTNWFDTKDAYRRMYLTDAGGKRTTTGFDQVDVMNPESVGTLVKGMGRAEGELKEEMFRRSVDAQSQLLEQLGKSHSVGPAIRAQLVEDAALGKRMLEGLNTAKNTSNAARAQRELLEDMKGIPMMEAATRVAVTAAEKTAMLVGLRQQAATVSGRINTAVTAAVSGAVKGAQVVGRAVKTAAKGQAAKAPRTERFDDAVERVNQAAVNPDRIAEQVVARTGDHAVASAVVGTVIRGNAFLKTKMPAPMIRDSDRQAHIKGTQRVGNSEMARWLRYVEAVEDPMSVIQSLEDGTLRREGAEALRVVHPRMYEDLKNRVTEQIAKEEDRMTRSKLVQLSILFDEPYHYSMEPEFLLFIQQNTAAQQEEAQQGGGFIAPSSRQPPDTSDDHMTEVQRISQ